MLVPLDGIANPLDGVKPSYDIFGKEFHTKELLLLSGFWGLAIIAVVAYMIRGGVAMAQTRNNSPGAHREAQQEFKNALMALCVLLGMSLIVGAAIWVFS